MAQAGGMRGRGREVQAMIKTILVKSAYPHTIGETVIATLSVLKGQWRVVAVVPHLLVHYPSFPKRYEVTEAELLIEEVE